MRHEERNPDCAAMIQLGIGMMLIGTAIVLAGSLMWMLARPKPTMYPQPNSTQQVLPTPYHQYDPTPQREVPINESKTSMEDIQMAKCALAVGVVAANLGHITLAEEVNLTYSNPPNRHVIITTGPSNVLIYSYSPNQRCRDKGMTKITIKCLKTQCIDVNTKQTMNTRRAWNMIKIYSVTRRVKRSQDIVKSIRTGQLNSNLFYKWLKYSARQVSQETCVACYNAKKIPQVRPIPGSALGSCADLDQCFAYCTMYMANRKYQSMSMDETVCPRKLDETLKEGDYSAPPLVKIPPTLIFPFCIVRGTEIEDVIKRYALTDSKGLVSCKQEVFGRRCATANTATIKCEQLVLDGEYITHKIESTDTEQYRKPSYAEGTVPLGDIFWLCEGDESLKIRLEPGWEGICTPVMLTGKVTVLVPQSQVQNKQKRDTQTQWKTGDTVYISYDQIPVGTPTEHMAISNDWIISGRIAGSLPFFGQVINAQYIARNSRWINYLWYNQQRFMNYTITALEGVKEQLHATSLMAMQNRFIIETILAEDQGVCDLIGEECCTVIPMHTGEGGNLTKALINLKELRQEHVIHSNWKTGTNALWSWLTNLTWPKLLRGIAMAVAMIVIIVVVAACCILPLVARLIKKMAGVITGQFPVQVYPKGEESDESLYMVPTNNQLDLEIYTEMKDLGESPKFKYKSNLYELNHGEVGKC